MSLDTLRQSIVDTFKIRLPELATIEHWQDQMTPENLRAIVAAQHVPAAFISFAGMKATERRSPSEPTSSIMTWVAFLVIPGRKDEAPPLDLVQKVAALVQVEDFGENVRKSPELDRAEFVLNFDAGRDMVSVYAVRWVLTSWLK